MSKPPARTTDSATPARERMSRVDTAWLRMDNDVNLMMIVGVWLLQPALDYEVSMGIYAYSERALPFFGRLVARDAESYRYLHESIRRFPPQRELADRMRRAGFARVAWRNMTLGVVALHSGWRI